MNASKAISGPVPRPTRDTSMGHPDRNVAPSSANPSLKGSTVEDFLNAKLFIDETGQAQKRA